MDWKEELQDIIKAECTDSDIEDYVEEHPEINEKEIWDYVYDYKAPNQCQGCKYIPCIGFPCTKCSRNATLTDRYERRRK